MGDRVDMFTRSWLEQREPVDHRSRASELVDLLADAWRRSGWQRVLDLGCGTGSNLRYLSPRLSGPQTWTLVDHDAELLALVTPVDAPISVTCLHGDLAAAGLPAAADTDLVTCSALLDLVTEDWARQLVQTSAGASCGVYMALSYNGQIQWEDEVDPDDELIRRAVNAHQRRDQGIRTALGPSAPAVVDRLLRAEGYQTWRASSPWQLKPADADLACALVDGWERAALELVSGPADADRIRGWAARRRRATRGPALSLRVGHDDLLGLPPRGR